MINKSMSVCCYHFHPRSMDKVLSTPCFATLNYNIVFILTTWQIHIFDINIPGQIIFWGIKDSYCWRNSFSCIHVSRSVFVWCWAFTTSMYIYILWQFLLLFLMCSKPPFMLVRVLFLTLLAFIIDNFYSCIYHASSR